MYKPELDPNLSVQAKAEWLSDNEGCEIGDGYSCLQTFLAYCCHDTKVIDGVWEILEDQINEQYDITKEEFDHEEEQEDDREDRAKQAAMLVVSHMIGAGLIGDLDVLSQQKWLNKIEQTVENFV